jgi:hypothetical protein
METHGDSATSVWMRSAARRKYEQLKRYPDGSSGGGDAVVRMRKLLAAANMFPAADEFRD